MTCGYMPIYGALNLFPEKNWGPNFHYEKKYSRTFDSIMFFLAIGACKSQQIVLQNIIFIYLSIPQFWFMKPNNPLNKINMRHSTIYLVKNTNSYITYN